MRSTRSLLAAALLASLGAPASAQEDAPHGALPFADLFDDAIAYAERGYPVSPTVAYHWERSARLIHAGLTGPDRSGPGCELVLIY